MTETRFEIIFKMLEQASCEHEQPNGLLPGSELTREEFDEISELRRLSLEISEPEPLSYTST